MSKSNHWNSPADPNLQQKKPPRRWPWIVLSIVVIVGLGIGALSFAVAKKRAEVAAKQAAFKQGPVSVAPPPPPPKPGAPVSCRPDKPRSTLTCFPADINPDAVLDGVAGEVGWQCLNHGEQDSDGNPIHEPRRCQGVNNVDHYRLKESISYETWDYQAGSAVQAITLDASTSAAEHKGQRTTRQDATAALMEVFARANPHLWQGKPQLQQEAATTFEQLKPRCATREGQSIAGASATTPSGYTIECSSPGGGVATGDVTTYEQQIKVQAR